MMKIKYIALCMLLALIGCQREEDISVATLNYSDEQIEALYYSAEVACVLSCEAPFKEAYVHFATQSDFADYQSRVMSKGAKGKYSVVLNDLEPDTTYYVRYEVSNRISTLCTKEYSEFRTMELSVPVLNTVYDSVVTYNSAVVGGNVTSDGGASVTERGVVYATTKNPTTNNTKVTSGTGLGSFTCNLTDLQPNTTYYVRAYAINEKGTAYGEEVSFTTNKQIVLPSVITATVTQITETTAVAGGNVTSDGGASVTERGVCISTVSNPTISNIKIAAGSGTGSFTCNLTGLQANTTYYVRAYAVNSKGTAYGEEVSFTTKEVSVSDPTGTENGYGYVDLGLSVKWATCNVGANTPEDYGDYFAWGETTTKDTYNWSTYKYCNGDSDLLTKYCNKSSYGNNGFTDNKTQLELSDDAARTNWGGSWRMPTDTEWTELREQCTWTWTTQNGVCGKKVTSKTNGNSIFLPAAGFRNDSLFYLAGSSGYYWSSSLHTDYPDCAWRVFFSSGGVRGYIGYRIRGQSVRPVLGENKGTETTVPTVITAAITQITESSAVAGGNVTSDGGSEITERGVVYATTQNPTTNNTKVTRGSGSGSFTCNLTDLQPNTTYYVRAYAVNSKGTAYGTQVSFTTQEQSSSGNGTDGTHEYVDLGLSVKWATMNVGASKPEDYGSYFAWGETKPKDVYDWSTYKWCNGSKTTLTKYNTSSSYGTVDKKNVLESSDDAATANWGGSWRMPTDAELTELRENCTWTWTTQNGVKGYKVTSKSNGNSIFLPAAGYRDDISLNYAGSFGDYWSSSLDALNPYYAWCVCFDSGSVCRYDRSVRCYGFSVRPVCP